MLREEIETVKALSRSIAKEEIAAIPKPSDPLKNLESLVLEIVLGQIEKSQMNIPAAIPNEKKVGRTDRKGGKQS